MNPSMLKSRCIKTMTLMLLSLLLLGAGGFFALARITDRFKTAVDESIKEMHPIALLQIAVSRAAMPSNDYLIHNDPAEREKWTRLSLEVDREFDKAFSIRYGRTEEEKLIRSARGEWEAGRPIAESIFALSPPEGNPAGASEMKRMDAHMDRAVDFLSEAHSLAEGDIEESLKTAMTVKRRITLFFIGIFGIGIGIAVKSGSVLFRSILLPLRRLEEGVRRFGGGELSCRIPRGTEGELGELVQAFNEMAEMLEKNHAEMIALSIHDGLTGLYNHIEFYRRLREEVERSKRYGRPFSMLMLDIDRFKTFNDTYGHQTGDLALRTVAGWIGLELRRKADQAARYGGEEFAVILPETRGIDAMKAAERIRQVIADRTAAFVNGQAVRITVSIGVATFPDDAETAEKLVSRADEALYAAKEGGRNRVCRAN